MKDMALVDTFAWGPLLMVPFSLRVQKLLLCALVTWV